jgi:hypothetical protein
MTSPSEKRGPGRPLGVKNGQGAKRKTMKKIPINMEAVHALVEIKKLTAEVARLNEALKLTESAYEGALLHIEATEKKHKAALIVIGYLEGKIFQS